MKPIEWISNKSLRGVDSGELRLFFKIKERVIPMLNTHGQIIRRLDKLIRFHI